MIRDNSKRIFDIGGVDYALVPEFLSNCPREQLIEIENNSPVG